MIVMMTCMICLKYMSNVSIYCGSLTKNKTKKTKKQKKARGHTHTSHKIADENYSNMNNKNKMK